MRDEKHVMVIVWFSQGNRYNSKSTIYLVTKYCLALCILQALFIMLALNISIKHINLKDVIIFACYVQKLYCGKVNNVYLQSAATKLLIGKLTGQLSLP